MCGSESSQADDCHCSVPNACVTQSKPCPPWSPPNQGSGGRSGRSTGRPMPHCHARPAAHLAPPSPCSSAPLPLPKRGCGGPRAGPNRHKIAAGGTQPLHTRLAGRTVCPLAHLGRGRPRFGPPGKPPSVTLPPHRHFGGNVATSKAGGDGTTPESLLRATSRELTAPVKALQLLPRGKIAIGTASNYGFLGAAPHP